MGAPDFMETTANTTSVETDSWRRRAWQSEAVVRPTSGPHLPEAEETKPASGSHRQRPVSSRAAPGTQLGRHECKQEMGHMG